MSFGTIYVYTLFDSLQTQWTITIRHAIQDLTSDSHRCLLHRILLWAFLFPGAGLVPTTNHPLTNNIDSLSAATIVSSS